MKIFHISDLHIRNGDAIYARYIEYMKCLQNFENIVRKNITQNNNVFVIAGDIFHNKNKIENDGNTLLTIFINTNL